MRASEVDRRHLSGPALRAFFRIAENWHLDTEQQMTLLGVASNSTYFKWKKDGNGLLPKDTLERISYLMGIYKALNVHFNDGNVATSWLKKPAANVGFGGQSALDRMLAGNVADLYVVRQFVDSHLGTWD